MKQYVRDGLSQKGRHLKATHDGFVGVDEQSLTDLLVYGSRYARFTRYYSENETAAGNWEPFFLSDEAVILSLVLNFDLINAEKSFIRIVEEANDAGNEYISSLIRQIHMLASTINLWHHNLTPAILSPGNRFSTILEGVIQKSLISQVHSILSFQSQIKPERSTDYFDTQGFTHIWRLSDASDEGVILPSKFSKPQIKEYFKDIFYTFYNSVEFLKQEALTCLETSLKNQDHSAQSSLFIAFASLYKNAQNAINNFTQRHFEYYYNDILKTSPLDLRPDHVHLLFPPLPAGDEILVPAGTEFIAGKDLSKKDLVYVSTQDVILNTAKIKVLRTFYLERNKLISPMQELDFVTTAKSAEIPVSVAAIMETDQPVISWPLFGASRSGYYGNTDRKDTDLGFAFASNILLLKEGKRSICCTLTFTEESYDVFEKLIQQLAKITKSSEPEIFEKSFYDGFLIYITGSTGWIRLHPEVIDCKIMNGGSAENTIKFYFQLDSDLPAVEAFQPEIHTGTFDTQLPVLKFLCNPDSYLYLYSLVRNLVVKSVRFDVDVKGLKNLVMYNNIGQLDPGQPIHPFGISPTLSSYFIVGAFEIRSKKMTNLELVLEWADLPRTYGGFEAYYSAYDQEIKYDSFKVKIEALEKGNWTQPENKKDQEYILFAYNENSGLLEVDTLLKNIYQPAILTPDFLESERDFLFDRNTLSGFIKLSLSSPSMAFGNSEYSRLISETLFANAKKKVPVALPNIPYNPILHKISINYSATAEITAYQSKSTESDRFHPIIYHMDPWGFDKVFPSKKGNPTYLLPQHQDEGHLMIGIANCTPPATISLFFHLKDDSIYGSQVRIPDPVWSYLDNNEWRQLKKSEIISDTTSKFLNSGIVTLSIPGVKDPDKNTLFAESLTWLKVAVRRNPEAVCSLLDIKTQAVEACWMNDNNSLEHLENALPPARIKKTRRPVPGVKEIVQPMSSFGGVLPEDEGEIYTRISERMKHKNRTGSGYDYEQMILKQFPEIMKVKCFPNLDARNRVKPGSILIVVIPKLKTGLKEGFNEEPLANSKLLNEIKTYIKNYSSPFAAIEVCNAMYEKVIVQCSVKFVKGIEGGYYLNLLNNELIERLSPWSNYDENRSRFGEPIQCADILSFIQNKSYIAFVTGFSLLQIVEDTDGHANWIDTVSKIRDKEDQTELKWELTPSFPSSILISAAKHSIEVIPEARSITPVPTGINNLELNSTFIIR